MYLSYIKKQIDEHGLFENFTMQTLLDKLDIIETYHYPRHKYHISELTKNSSPFIGRWMSSYRVRYKIQGFRLNDTHFFKISHSFKPELCDFKMINRQNKKQ